MGEEPPVYQPSEDSWLLIDCLSMAVATGLVVEVGCGSGVVTQLLAERGAEVIAVDISDAAVNETKSRCRLHLSCVHLLRGDALKALHPSKKVSLIVTNPPYLPSEEITDIAIFAGPTGAEFIKDLIDESRQFIEKGSKLVFIASTLSNIETIIEHAARSGLRIRKLSSRRLFFEEIGCYEVRKESK